MIKDLLAGCASLVFPPHCYLCQKPLLFPHTNVVCSSCLSQLKVNSPPFCIKCSRHLNQASSYCRDCLKRKMDFDFAYSALQFNASLKTLLHHFKYHHKTSLRLTFAQQMKNFVDYYNFDLAQFDLIIPIPMHPSSLRLRGYNQSYLLAKEISRYFFIPLNSRILFKNRPTASQSELKRKERFTNVSGAFTIRHSHLVRSKNVLLVDDLLTTGATVSSCAATLKRAGCAQVGVLTLASVT